MRIVLVISLSVMLYGLELVLLKNELMLQLLEKLRNLNKLK